MYGVICRKSIVFIQWARSNSTAIWLIIISNMVLAGTNIFSNGPTNVTIFLLFLSIFFVIVLLLKEIDTIRWLMYSYIKYRFDQSKIAVLDGRIDETDMEYHIPNNIRYLPYNWKLQLEAENLIVDLISVSKISKKYSMIINPFGSNYIEEDFSNLKTFYKIKNYIHEGGVFINTWNLAFWEAWDSKNNSKLGTSSGVETFELNTQPATINNHFQNASLIRFQPIIAGYSLVDTWLLNIFGVHTTTFQSPQTVRAFPIPDYLQDVGELDITEFRAAINSEKQDMTFYRLISARTNQNFEFYPVTAINYYIGYLVLFGTDITNNNEFNYECKIIKKLYNQLSQNGSL